MPTARVASAEAIDEPAVLAAAIRGEPAAFRALVRRYERAVFSQLRGVLLASGRTALVEDLAQETFLRAFRALPRYTSDGRAKFSTWLAVMGDPAHDAPLVGRGVEAAVLSLSPPLRAAFLLRELHGFDYADIAEALDVDLGTVKSRLSRARARLREALGGET
jgi:RNA polymerase sigma-70 factor (ECF subfamily)